MLLMPSVDPLIQIWSRKRCSVSPLWKAIPPTLSWQGSALPNVSLDLIFVSALTTLSGSGISI